MNSLIIEVPSEKRTLLTDENKLFTWMISVDTSKAVNLIAIIFKLIGKETIWREVPDSYSL